MPMPGQSMIYHDTGVTSGLFTARIASYAIAVTIGVLAVIYALPWSTIMGAGLFRFPVGDLALNLLGHLAFQTPGWHWPLFNAPDLAWPHGESIAMTDSNPALSLLAKPMAALLGYPVNLLGLWLAACLILQPVAANYALRGLSGPPDAGSGRNIIAATIAASLLVLLLPAFLFRYFHINLLGQFLLLLALGVAARGCRAARPLAFAPAFALLTLAMLIHPYLFMFSVLLLAAPGLHLLVHGLPQAREALRTWALASLLPAFGFMLLNGTLGGGGPGFGLYSMNLLGPVWPQYSGLFGASLPLLDATGFQHEGFNYLGAGNLLLFLSAAFAILAGGGHTWRMLWHRGAGLFVVLLCLTAIGVTPHITVGHAHVTDWDIPLLDRLLSAMRASGRAIWGVDYALILGAVALLAARLPARYFVPLMAVVVTLQWADTAPLRIAERAYFAGAGQNGAPLTLTPDTRLFRVVPFCGDDAVLADQYRLLAIRAGARLAETRLARPALDAACAQSLAAGLDGMFAPGETRLFLPSIAPAQLRGHFTADITCVPTKAGLLCHKP